jgi:hypothetical protein
VKYKFAYTPAHILAVCNIQESDWGEVPPNMVKGDIKQSKGDKTVSYQILFLLNVHPFHGFFNN